VARELGHARGVSGWGWWVCWRALAVSCRFCQAEGAWGCGICLHRAGGCRIGAGVWPGWGRWWEGIRDE
jgi:hypothetical protein